MPRGSTPPAAPDSPDAVDDLELIDDDLDSLLDSALNGQDETEVPVLPITHQLHKTKPSSLDTSMLLHNVS